MKGLNKGPILVTGATGGIGGVIVRHLTDAGATVIANWPKTQAAGPSPLIWNPRLKFALPSKVWICGAW